MLAPAPVPQVHRLAMATPSAQEELNHLGDEQQHKGQRSDQTNHCCKLRLVRPNLL